MFLAEAKEEDGQMTKNWTEDTGGVLVFVSLKTFYFVQSRLKELNVKDWSFLGHCCVLYHVKSSPTLSRFGQSDSRVAFPTRQHILRSARRSAGHAVQSASVYCQGQRDVVPQFDPQLVLRAACDFDAAMVPKISGLCAAPWCAHNEATYSGVHSRRG